MADSRDALERIPGDVPQCACNALRRASRAVTQLYEEALRPAGLTATQFSLLATLAHTGSLTMSEFADRMVMDRTTLPRTLKPLVQRKLVTAASGKDRRERHLVITAKGTRALADAAPLWRRAQERIAGRLGDERWAAMLDELAEAVRLARSE